MRKYRPSELAVKLDEAADLLENSGWCRHVLKNPAGHHCLAGAVYEVTGARWSMLDDGEYDLDTTNKGLQLMEAVEWAAETDPSVKGRYPVGWNDEQRDKRKVVRFMRRTARRLRDGKLRRKPGNPWDQWVAV